MDGVCIWRTETDGVCAWSAEMNGICVRRTVMAYVSAERKWIAYMEMCARPFVNKKLFFEIVPQKSKKMWITIVCAKFQNCVNTTQKCLAHHSSGFPCSTLFLLIFKKKQISHSRTPTFEARSYGGENDSVGVRVKNDSDRSLWRTIVKTTETTVNTTPISPRPLSCTGVIGISWHFN